MSDADYFREIEGHFIGRRGTPFVLNPKDWALMREWAEQKIPLPIIIEAIDSVFDRFDAAERRVNGLSFCKDAVKKLWKERRELQVGANEAVPEEGAEPSLNELADLLETSAPSFAPRVRELARERSVAKIEERLIELEHELAMSLATEDIRAEAASAAAGNERAEEAHLRRLVRERFGVPRLTLFR